jgi:hypothetical protein
VLVRTDVFHAGKAHNRLALPAVDLLFSSKRFGVLRLVAAVFFHRHFHGHQR